MKQEIYSDSYDTTQIGKLEPMEKQPVSCATLEDVSSITIAPPKRNTTAAVTKAGLPWLITR